MKKLKKIRLLLWHKLAILLVIAMLILTGGFVLTLRTASNRASLSILEDGQEILSDQAELFLSNVVAGQARTLDLQLNQAQEAAFYGAYILSENPSLIAGDADTLKAFLQTIYERSGKYTAVAYYVDQAKQLTPYLPQDAPTLPTYYDLDSLVPALKALPSDHREPVWGQIHESFLVTQQNVIDVVAPIMTDNLSAGYIGISISLTDLIAQFNQQQPIRGSYSFIIDETFQLVAAPPHGRLDLVSPANLLPGGEFDLRAINNKDLEAVLQNMALGQTAVEQVVINENSKYIAYQPLENINWRIGTSVPVALATASSARLIEGVNTASQQMSIGVLMVGSLLLIIVLLVGSILTRQMITPLLEMEAITNSIAAGDLNRQVKIASTDEIGRLANSFNYMTTQLRQTLQGLELRNEQLFQEIEERKRVEIALRDSEEQFRQLVELMPDTVVIHSQGKVLFTNPAGVKLLGAESHYEIIGQPVMRFVSSNFVEVVQKRIQETQQEMKEIPPIEEKLIRIDGSLVDAEVSGVPFIYKGHPATQLVIRDITERKRLEEQVHLQERLAVVGQLAAGIAHDFNNLLMTIMLNAELIPYKYDVSDEAKAALEQIVEQGQRAAQLTQQILDFSRKSIHDPHPMDFASFLKEQTKFMGRTISEKIKIDLKIEPTIHTVFADPTQMQQIITNLMVNARDAMPEGGQLNLSLSRQLILENERPCADVGAGDWVVMTVADTGAGISEEVLPHIFEPFFTTKDVGKGTGLGLAQVYGIVKQNDGCIAVNSNLGRGTSFTIYLPFYTTSSDSTQLVAANTASTGNRETVLIVEDDPAVLEVTQSMLETLNYNVLVARDGMQALVVYREHANQIDLVLTDAVMPNMDGMDLVKLLKFEFENAKILVMSGYPGDEAERPKMQQYVQAWLQKPLSLQKLSTTLRAALLQ